MLKRIDELNICISDFEIAIKEHKDAAEALSREVKPLREELDSITSSVRDEMLENGVLEEQREGVTFKLRKLPQRIDIFCKPEELPEQYQRIKIEADKRKIKEAVKNGEGSNFAKLTEPEYKLEIKHEV